MRVLYVSGHYPPDLVSGATLQVQRLARHVAAAGHDVAVLAGAFGAGLADDELRVERAGAVTIHWLGTAGRIDQADDRNWLNSAAASVMGRLLDEWRPDVVHAHALQTLGADLLDVAMARGVPTVVTMHDFWWWCPRLFLVDRSLRPCPPDTTTSACACARDALWRRQRAAHLAPILGRMAEVLVPSAGMAELVVANGVARERVVLDPNDVDLDRLPDAAAPARPGRTTRFLYVGGNQPLKGRDVLLAAAARLRRRRGWTLDAYGVVRPPRQRRHPWRTRPVRQLRVHPAFPPEAAADVYGAADVLVIPSLARESFSIAAREALAAGLAVITSDCLGPTEVVHDDVNGRVVPLGDDGALADAMLQLIDDPVRLARYREHARRHAAALRRAQEHAESLLRRYARLARAAT